METYTDVRNGGLRYAARRFTLADMPSPNHSPAPLPLVEAPAAAMTDDIFCPDCSQNLRGTVSDRCPECGASVADLRSVVSQIPWTHRSDNGWLRSYWQTVYVVLFRTRRFCTEIARPVSYADAQAFRWLTVLHAWLPIVALVLAVYWRHPPKPVAAANDLRLFESTSTLGAAPPTIWEGPAYTDIWPAGVALAAFLVWLLGATGVPSYFFHPRHAPIRMQNRAIAISYYSAAPLTLTFCAVGIAGWGLLGADPFDMGLWVGAAATVFLALLLWWMLLAGVVARKVLVATSRRILLLRILISACWCVLALVTFVALPMATLAVVVVLDSLS